MENETQHKKPPKKDYAVPVSVLIAGAMFASAWAYTAKLDVREVELPAQEMHAVKSKEAAPRSVLEERVLPSEGVVLPATWGNLGVRMVEAGVIDADKFMEIYPKRGTFSEEYENLLLGQSDEQIRITEDNAGYLLNLFWALGLASKNPVLEFGEMTDEAYGGAENFASTGGWSVSRGSPMAHYSRHTFFTLSPEEQVLVEKMATGIYRPCCGNSTHFPDCNHGMAMLGLLELMASQGASEGEMWKAALAVNSYWFPDMYLSIAIYMKQRGVEWNAVSPSVVLGADYSSASGYAKVAAQVEGVRGRGQGGCGVEQPGESREQKGGCGI